MDNLLEMLRGLDWGLEVFVVVTLTMVVRYIVMRMLKVMGKHLHKTENVWDDAVFEAARGPLSWFILVMGLIWAVEIGETSLSSDLFSSANMDLVRQLTFVVLITMFAVRFVSQVEIRVLNKLQAESAAEQTSMDPSTLRALAKLLRMSAIISAALVAMPTLGIEIGALLAFGGVGGIAVGFAAKDLLANFFGGLMIYLDRPFAIGDWIRSPDRNIEGTVESIGWRLTLVRTFDKRPLYVPNSVFTTLALENPSRMTHRRIYETIGLRYQDAAKLADIIVAVKSMLKSHAEIDASQTMIVNFNAFAASSLDFFVYTFTKTTNWVKFHEIKQDVLLQIVKIIHAHDADIAFPTMTLDGIDGLRPEPGQND